MSDIPIWIAIMFGFIATIPLNIGVAIFNMNLANACYGTMDGKPWPKKREWLFDKEKYWYPISFVIIWVVVSALLEICV